MFIIFQFCPIYFAALLLAKLNTKASSARGYIHVGGIITSIAIAIGLLNQVTYLTNMQGFIMIDINHYLNSQ